MRFRNKLSTRNRRDVQTRSIHKPDADKRAWRELVGMAWLSRRCCLEAKTSKKRFNLTLDLGTVLQDANHSKHALQEGNDDL